MRWGELVARPLHEHAMVGKVRSHSLKFVQNRMVSCLSESPVYSDNAWQCLNSVRCECGAVAQVCSGSLCLCTLSPRGFHQARQFCLCRCS